MTLQNDTNIGFSLTWLNNSTLYDVNTTNCTVIPSSRTESILSINKVLTPFIYTLGFPGNILSFIVWTKPRMRHSSGVYLAALAMADFIFLLLHLLYELNQTWKVNTINYPVMCECFTVIFLSFQYLVPLLVLAFTVERYISICYPFKREQFCTTRRARIVSFSLAACSLAICAIQGYFWTYGTQGCSVRNEATEGENKSLWFIYSWITEMLIFLVVPLCVLLFNIRVIMEAKRISDYGHPQLQGRSANTSATTIMLLAVSFYLIFSTLPVTVVYVSVLHFKEGSPCVDQNIDPTWRKHWTYQLIRVVIEKIGMTHFAFNFYIYLLTGKMFRKEFKDICMHVVGKALPDKVRREYSHLRTSLSGTFTRNVTVTFCSNGTTVKTTENGGETVL